MNPGVVDGKPSASTHDLAEGQDRFLTIVDARGLQPGSSDLGSRLGV